MQNNDFYDEKYLKTLSKDELIALYTSLSKENKRIQKENSKALVELRKAYKAIGFLVNKLENKDIKLKEQLCDRFGIKSDKYEVVNGVKLKKDETLANEAEVIIELDKKAPKKRGRKPRTLDCQKFNKEIIEHEVKQIDNNIKKCDLCGDELEYIGTRTYQKVEYIPAKIKLIEYEVKRYKCKNCNTIYELDEDINTFDNESLLTPSLAAFIVNNKYNYALPLYRQEQMFNQLGAPISRQSLANYCITIANKLSVIKDRMKDVLIKSEVIIKHADETTYRIIKLPEGEKRQKCYIWLFASSMYDKPIYIYEYQRTREKKHPTEFLKGYKGYLICDD